MIDFTTEMNEPLKSLAKNGATVIKWIHSLGVGHRLNPPYEGLIFVCPVTQLKILSQDQNGKVDVEFKSVL